jgi:hypothetical protein
VSDEHPPAFAVRPFVPEDAPAVVDLLTSVFATWPRQLRGADPAAAFRWKHLESPFGPSVMVVAEADGAVIGFEALLRWPSPPTVGRSTRCAVSTSPWTVRTASAAWPAR